MSEATHYWPEVQGPYEVAHGDGMSTEWVLVLSDWGRRKVWHQFSVAFTEAELIERGYLGVRCGAAKPIIARVTLRDGGEHKPPRNALLPDPDDGNAMVAQQALDELRVCQTKPAESERWFYKWGPVLCQMLGAR